MHQLEKEGHALFNKIKDNDSISNFYYKSKEKIGSRLDIALVSSSASREMSGTSDVVRWRSLDKLLAKNPKANEIKEYIKEISASLSDHLPVVTRFYFQEQE
jgi:exonuclease III